MLWMQLKMLVRHVQTIYLDVSSVEIVIGVSNVRQIITSILVQENVNDAQILLIIVWDVAIQVNAWSVKKATTLMPVMSVQGAPKDAPSVIIMTKIIASNAH